MIRDFGVQPSELHSMPVGRLTTHIKMQAELTKLREKNNGR
jgi:hypothetical protein